MSMSKIYQGNNKFLLVFDSGTEVILELSEIKEILDVFETASIHLPEEKGDVIDVKTMEK